jgi:hypothetical protein
MGDMARVVFDILAGSTPTTGNVYRRRGRDDGLVRILAVHDGHAELSADLDPQHIGPMRDMVGVVELRDHYVLVGRVQR